MMEDIECDVNVNSSTEEKRDFSCQAVLEITEEATFKFEAVHEGQNASTQANIPKQASFQTFKKYKDSESQTHRIGMIGFDTVKTDQQLSEIAGVTFSVFQLLLQLFEITWKSKLLKENILLLFLMKMKLGISFAALGYFFNLHRTTCSRIFVKLLNVLSIKTTNFIFWPSKSTVQLLLPEAFRKLYPNCRVIIDCSELKAEEPPRADQRVFMYSNYKHSYTVKFLIGITPYGFISYISKCYGGRSSDGFIVNHSKFLDLLEPKDEVLADKGFPQIQTDSGAITVIPPILNHGRFSEEESSETYNIASVRIQVERAIQRIKIYNILQKINVDLLPHINKVVRMSAVLANLQPPIIKKGAEITETNSNVDCETGSKQCGEQQGEIAEVKTNCGTEVEDFAEEAGLEDCNEIEVEEIINEISEMDFENNIDNETEVEAAENVEMVYEVPPEWQCMQQE